MNKILLKKLNVSIIIYYKIINKFKINNEK